MMSVIKGYKYTLYQKHLQGEKILNIVHSEILTA